MGFRREEKSGFKLKAIQSPFVDLRQRRHRFFSSSALEMSLFLVALPFILYLIFTQAGEIFGIPLTFDPSIKSLNTTEAVRDWKSLIQFLTRPNENPASYLSTPEVLELYGYPCESHNVRTEDGYILNLHRIPHGKVQRGADGVKNQRPVVFLQHGLFGSSFEWFMNTPDRLLALQLADEGYDVWLGNARGNVYSRGHVTRSPKNADFWEFSFHEMGKYDLPASIDYILTLRGLQNLKFVGFSLGSTMFWIMMSLRPEFNHKVRVMTALAPVAYLNNMKGFPRHLVPFQRILKTVSDIIFGGICFPEWLTQSFNFLVTKACSNLFLAETICAKLVFLCAGWDLPQMQFNQLPVLAGHAPSPTSTRVLSHLSQFVDPGIFQEYDFGDVQNQVIYGNPFPRNYSLLMTSVPVAIFWGQNDPIVDPVDALRVTSQIPNLISSKPVNFSFWNHIDYHLAKDVNALVNEPILTILRSYS